jgi:hypothetical protein
MARGKKSFDRQEVCRIGKRLSELGAEVSGFGKSLEDADFKDQLQVDAGDMMYLGLKSIGDWLTKVQGAYRNANVRPGSAPKKKRA